MFPILKIPSDLDLTESNDGSKSALSRASTSWFTGSYYAVASELPVRRGVQTGLKD